eukprot:9644444-Lingulodinium_polyedra.AAC.1
MEHPRSSEVHDQILHPAGIAANGAIGEMALPDAGGAPAGGNRQKGAIQRGLANEVIPSAPGEPGSDL